MKNISMKIALVGSLLINIAFANPIGRAGLDKVIRQFTIKQIKALNQDAHELTSNPFAHGKKYAESLLLDVWHKAVQKGIIPSGKEFAELDNSFGKANHGILNLAGEGGHTLLKYALELPALSKKELAKRRSFLKALTDRGAELNVRDIHVMGPEKVLKSYLNLPIDASAWTTVKAYRTLFTKLQRSHSSKMLELETQKRIEKIQEVFPLVEKDLLAQRVQEQKARLFSKII